MKRILLYTLAFFVTHFALSQVSPNQVDDFEDGSTENWVEAASSAAQAENISSDGPAGVNDNYLRDYTTQAPGGPGSRMIIRNLTQWSGNFTAAGVESVTMDVRALNVDVTVRVSITGPGGKFSSSTGIVVTAGSGWTQVSIPIAGSDMVSVSDGNDGGSPGTDINATLAGVTEFRILSNPSPSWIGEVTDAEMHLDNITASGSLSVVDFENQQLGFRISPNPGKNKLNIRFLDTYNDLTVEVFDVLGKRIYKSALTRLESSINVSNWKSGVYLVKVSDNESTKTKRFIKQ
jgi:hypothetical protein